jgi:hypothetical protein
VQKIVTEHNHYLASPNKSHKLRSQRRVTEADRMLIGQIRDAGMKPSVRVHEEILWRSRQSAIWEDGLQ